MTIRKVLSTVVCSLIATSALALQGGTQAPAASKPSQTKPAAEANKQQQKAKPTTNKPTPASATPAKPQSGALTLPAYRKLQLKNGMTVLLMEQRELPLISFSFVVKAGNGFDPQGKEGAGSLTAELLRKGTKTRSAQQFADELDFLGGTFTAEINRDYIGGSAEFMSKDIAKGIELLADALINPAFPAEEVDKAKRQRVDEIKSAKDQPQAVIEQYFDGYLYGSHPYGRPDSGTETSVPTITREDIVSFYSTYFTPSNTIMAVVGDFQAADMERMLNERFGAWPAKQAPMAKLAAPQPVTGRKLLFIDKPDATQTFFNIGNLGIERTNADRVGLNVVNTLFGGRFTSMLNSALRIQSGLTYGARSAFDQAKMQGPFTISTYTKNATTQQAIDMTLDILKKLHDTPLTQEQLDSAKAYIKGQYPPRIETSSQLATLLASNEYYGIDTKQDVDTLFQRIDAVDIATTQRLIKQYYPMENLVFVLIGKQSEVGNLASKWAPKVDRKSINDPGF
jgi:predicted Zn-dependent peptidase